MQDFQGITDNLYSILAGRALPFNYTFALQIEENLLELIEKQRTNDADSVLLAAALRCELLADFDPKIARQKAREILSRLVNLPERANHFRLRGICFYVIAVTTAQMTRFSDPCADLYFLRKAVEAFPGHWNAAAVLADKLFNAGAPFEEVQQILASAVRSNGELNIRARYQEQLAYLAFRAGKDDDAIKHYEKARTLRPLAQLHLCRLAASYGRTEQYEKALFIFQQAHKEVNNVQCDGLRFDNSFFGISHSEIWRLAEEAVKDYRDHRCVFNTVRLALVFEFLPVNYSNDVCSLIARRIDALNHNDQSVFDAHAEAVLKQFNQWFDKYRLPLLALAKRDETLPGVAVSSGARRVAIAYLE